MDSLPTERSITGAIAHPQNKGIAFERGTAARFGGRGNGISVYFRDLDGSLMEFISYHE